LTNAAGTQGYAFAQVHPRIKRNLATRTIELGFEIDQGPRVYIEKINISGNTRTQDDVIRRQFRLQEGDAFNMVLIDRSRTRIRSLGFFKEVEVKNVPGSQPDRTNLTVAVTEQSTASLSVGLGYSSTTSILGEVSYTDSNWFGRGQNLRATIQASYITKEAEFSFTEPNFLGRDGLAAGFDLYETELNFQQATYQSETSAAVLRLAYPISEYSTVALNYTYKVEDIEPFGGAPVDVIEAAGTLGGSIIGFNYFYSDLDDVRKPTNGATFSFGQSMAGFGGNLKFISTNVAAAAYSPMFDGALVGSIQGRAGYITGYNGSLVPFEERFFDGGDTFRGFALAGIGPRDIVAQDNTGSLGGTVHAIGTAQVRFPSLLPESYGINAALFTDFGTLGRIDSIASGTRTCTGAQYSGIGSCIKDNLAFRGSAGLSFQWKSPFGPVQIDLALPYAKTFYDRPQILHFSTATGY
jgi:outer membrane protein insertion porin family